MLYGLQAAQVTLLVGKQIVHFYNSKFLNIYSTTCGGDLNKHYVSGFLEFI